MIEVRRERPILFNSLMVRAILGGTKTQTRRKFKNIGDKCPYGSVGDRLWVREKFCIPEPRYFVYAADVRESELKLFKWKPSIFMLKIYCRLFLEITDIRIERLNKITEQDAIEEGVGKVFNTLFREYRYTDYMDCGSQCRSAVSSYKTLWESINGVGSWEKNPFVWVVSFKRVEK